MICAENIAAVLGCSADDVEREAVRMGLRAGEANPEWITRGFVTLIRNNWYLLPYEQLMQLMDYTAEKLEFVLMKEDFLWFKLGSTKPECEAVHYEPLTDEQIKQTEEIAKTVKACDTSGRVPFDFYRDHADREPQCFTSTENGIRMVHPYLTPCADPFIEDTRSHLPDAILEDYARFGVNALEIHGVLSTLSPYPFDPEQSHDYKVRRENLRDLVMRAGKRGIKVYLYFNEPRAIARDTLEKYGRPELAGNITSDGQVSLCLELEENREYLYNAVRDLFADIPEIGGVVSTTMSENRTHCRSHGKGNCPRCSALPAEVLPVLVNNIIEKAVRDSGSDAKVIAAMWAWEDDQLENGIPRLDKNIGIWAVSEWGNKINKGGIESEIVDYSIAYPGPSEMTRRIFDIAHKSGHSTLAKIQVSNSWELAVVPYLPVFDIEFEHLKNLTAEGTKDFQLTWTLGSYPSITFDMISDYLTDTDSFSLDKWYEKHFGTDAVTVHKAVKHFCDAYREYPFSIFVAYYSPKNVGVANRWSLTKNTDASSMVCWSFDDFEKWMNPYTPEVYLDQLDKMIAYWEKGCELLDTVANGSEVAGELALFARVALNHLRADALHSRYALCKRNLPESRDEMLGIIEKERELTEELLTLVPRSTMIGFETSNHYFYTERDLIEKLIQLDALQKELDT